MDGIFWIIDGVKIDDIPFLVDDFSIGFLIVENVITEPVEFVITPFIVAKAIALNLRPEIAIEGIFCRESVVSRSMSPSSVTSWVEMV